MTYEALAGIKLELESWAEMPPHPAACVAMAGDGSSVASIAEVAVNSSAATASRRIEVSFDMLPLRDRKLPINNNTLTTPMTCR